MNVLLLGSGGREHALAWKLVQSRGLDTLYAAPGNPGIARIATLVPLDATDHAAVTAFVRENKEGTDEEIRRVLEKDFGVKLSRRSVNVYRNEILGKKRI